MLYLDEIEQIKAGNFCRLFLESYSKELYKTHYNIPLMTDKEIKNLNMHFILFLTLKMESRF